MFMYFNQISFVMLSDFILLTISVSWISSTIIADNAFYQSHLSKFLAPAVGNDSNWKLCFRASLHGWTASDFHSRCDGKRNTVVIVRVGEYVFGGYTDLPWGK